MVARRIWGRLSSVNVQKVVFAAEELAIPYERIDAGGAFGVVDTPEYRAMNPNGLVPVLQEGEFVLWESNAIVRYLAAAHAAGTAWPDDPAERALADRWTDWQSATLNPAMWHAFVNLVRTSPEKRDMAAVAASQQRAEALFAILDDALAGRDFLAAGRLTIAELVLAPSVHRWLNMPHEAGAHPNIRRWYTGLMERPAARAAMPLPVV